MNESLRVCRACDLPGAPENFEAIERSILEYHLLPGDRIAEQTVYVARLEKCLVCGKRSGVTCMECGCFVQLRAMDSTKDCPHPEGSLW